METTRGAGVHFAPFGSAGMLIVMAGLGLLGTTGLHTAFFPTLFLAYFAIGLGIGMAFMPLLTIAMADVPAEDAGLGSGIVNVSQQVAGALGLAVLGTVATKHSLALEAQHHSLAASLIGGYHLAFTIGVISVAIGLVTALVILRGSPAEDTPPALEIVDPMDEVAELEHQAA